jgi:dihydrofolate reductase
MSMSLDGFVADTEDGVAELHGWYSGGEVEVPGPTGDFVFRTDPASADELRGAFESVGAVVSGRRNFEIAGAWGGRHPMGVPTFIVTHQVPDGWPRSGSDMHFVTDGVERAVQEAQEAAGEKTVAIASPSIAQQCLEAGLLDGIRVSLIPVLLGRGVRYFDGSRATLDGPEVVEGNGVTHLYYGVRR